PCAKASSLALEATVSAAATAAAASATGANFEGRIVVALSFAPFGSPVFKPDLRSNPRRHRLPGRHVGIAIPGEGRLQRLQLTTAEVSPLPSGLPALLLFFVSNDC
uniref:Secreted protein n=1 Tax=Macrostomum lignano TaxID=282301 RepID=A0A1I8HQN3_9PLAT